MSREWRISDQICCSKQVDGRVVKKGELAAFYACCLNTRSPSGEKMKQSSGIFYAHHQEYSDAVCPNICFLTFFSCAWKFIDWALFLFMYYPWIPLLIVTLEANKHNISSNLGDSAHPPSGEANTRINQTKYVANISLKCSSGTISQFSVEVTLHHILFLFSLASFQNEE